MAAFNYMPGREPGSERYMHMLAIFVIVVLANLLAGVRIPKRVVLVAGLVTAVVAVSNVVPLYDGQKWMAHQSHLTRANLAALEIARSEVPPEFQLISELATDGGPRGSSLQEGWRS